MSPETSIIGPLEGQGAVQPLSSQVRELIRASKAESTVRGYKADWNDFCAWCERHYLNPLPATAETVASYIAECAGRLKVGSIERRLNSISEAHKAMGMESPTHHAIVANVMKGIRRTKGTAAQQKTPALTADIKAMVDATDAGIIGVRDRALVLLGFAGAFRRSELVGLDVGDCTFSKDGLTVTDQMGEGRRIGIPYGANPETCPVRNLQYWTEQASITGGPLFRSINRHRQIQPGRLSGIDVARIVKNSQKGPVWTPASMPGTHSVRDMRLRRRLRAHRNGPSCARPAIGVCRWCGGTSGMPISFGRTARGSWDCK